MDIGLVIEGHNGLTWERWRRIVRRADGNGLASLFRSDHFGEHDDALEAYISLTLAAAESTSVRLGTLVTPITFRTPVEIGRMAAQIDALSGGRFVLGLGIGWNESEHRAYGIDFPPTRERFDRLEEVIGVCRTLWSGSKATFQGRYFSLTDVDCRPKPVSEPLPILLGGVGERRTLKIVAQYADEWCSECLSLEEYRRKVQALERHCDALSRDPKSIRRSMVVTNSVIPTVSTVVKGALLQARSTVRPESGRRQFDLPGRLGGLMVGGRKQMVDALGRYAELGLQEAIFKQYDFDSDSEPDYLSQEIAPAVRSM
jgi:F420-dependent oxidoreductase-like protein